MLILEEADWRVYDNSLYYICNFSVSLNLFHNKKVLFKKKSRGIKNGKKYLIQKKPGKKKQET